MSTDEIIKEIEKLPELELEKVIEFLAEHTRRNKFDHLIEASFRVDQTDEIEELRRDLDYQEEERERFEDENRELKKSIAEIKKIVI